MAKTNTKTPRRPIRTHEGGPAVHVTTEEQLRRSVNACLLWEDTFYEDGESIAERIINLATNVDEGFLHFLAKEVRQEHGIRHASLLLAVAAIKAGHRSAGETVNAVVQRADELAEIVSIYWLINGGRSMLPRQLRKGLNMAFNRFDGYQLAKYANRGDIKLRDVMFLSHPKPKTPEQAALFKGLADKTLNAPDTWEVGLSAGEDKKAVFERLLRESKLGGLATLRNLRNMVEAGVNPEQIENRIDTMNVKGILPFQFIAAAKHGPMFEKHLDAAMLRSLIAMDQLGGWTAVLIDVSGSMGHELSGRGTMTRREAAAGIGMLAIARSTKARCWAWGTRQHEVPPRASLSLTGALDDATRHTGHGTFGGQAVSNCLKEMPGVDRIILITDEQMHDALPKLPDSVKGYCINVAAYQNGVGYREWTHIDGFSAKTVDYILQREKDLAW